MNFEKNWSTLFEDINIPELFVSNHLTNANGDYVKLYLYCMFISKHNGDISPLNLSKKLSLPLSTVEQGLKYWEENGVMTRKQKNYILNDLKQQEIGKLYTPKLTSLPEDAVKNTSKNIQRTKIVNAINSMFFQGVMSPTWYTDIDTLFAKYKFEEDVVYSLFQYCFDRQALHRKYLFTVADAWAQSGIVTMEDVDNYYNQFEKTNQMKKSIGKKLGFVRNLSEYEEAYVNKWVNDFNYPLDIIEIALKKTTSKTNPSFDYIDKILTDWHERKLNSVSDINEFLKTQREKQKEFKQLDLTSAQSGKTIQKYHNNVNSQLTDLSQFYAN